MFRNLLLFLFTDEITRTDEHRRSSTRLTPLSGEEATRFRLVSFFSWILSAVLLISFVGVFALVFVGKPVPEVVPPIITGIIGYFGGAIAAYFGVRPT